MTNKFREKFFFVVLSNMTTIIILGAVPFIIYDNPIMEEYRQTLSTLWVSFKQVFILLIIVLLVVIVIYNILLKKRTQIHESEKLKDINTEHLQMMIQIQQDQKQRIKEATEIAVAHYVQHILCSYVREEDIQLLIENIKNWTDVKGFQPSPIATDGRLSTLDIRHISWNIGKRMGWNGNQCAVFAKLCFPIEMKELEVETIRRNLRQKRSCIIELDIPEKGSFTFHTIDTSQL